MYRLHKWLGITALVAAVAHWWLAQGTKWMVGWGWLTRPARGPREPITDPLRAWFDGPLALSGSIASGASILAAQAMGADFAYVGSAFIATEEARASEAYKQCIVDSTSDDVVYTNLFTGVHGNYLAPSIRAAGLDPEHLPESDPSHMNFGATGGAKAWKDIWGCGQGIGAIDRVLPAADLVARFRHEYQEAKAHLLSL
jgi:nitronate monooxygenase